MDAHPAQLLAPVMWQGHGQPSVPCSVPH
jgi:hypothetical protein